MSFGFERLSPTYRIQFVQAEVGARLQSCGTHFTASGGVTPSPAVRDSLAGDRDGADAVANADALLLLYV
jgi:hypothetical protein